MSHHPGPEAHSCNQGPAKSTIKPLSDFIFFSRWLQAPLYVGLVIGQAYYVYRFSIELAEIFEKPTMSENDAVCSFWALSTSS